MKPAFRFGPLAAAGAVLAVLAIIISSQAAGSNPDSFAVDFDTSGNSATALGAPNECVEVNAGDTVTFDVTVTNIPASAPAALGFAFFMSYDASHFAITGADGSFLLASAPGSSILLAGDETALPDTDGSFAASVADTAQGAAESGSGVLERLTMTVDAATPAGGYAFGLTESATLDAQNHPHVPDHLLGGRLAVGVTCESLPTPTAAPTNKQGDVDCTGNVNSVDSLKVLRHVAQLTVVQTEPCTDIGTGAPLQGDVDCNGNVNSVDALKILRFVAGLTVVQTEPCPDIGT